MVVAAVSDIWTVEVEGRMDQQHLDRLYFFSTARYAESFAVAVRAGGSCTIARETVVDDPSVLQELIESECDT